MIVVVTGPPGVGKTTWIKQQMAQVPAPLVYFNPGTDCVPIDQTCIAIEFPNVQSLNSDQMESASSSAPATTKAKSTSVDDRELGVLKFLQLLENMPQATAYVELGFYLDISMIEQVLAQKSCYRIAVMPQNTKNTGWHAWADEIVPGAKFETIALHQIFRALLTGEVLDFASLEVFWYELTQGAYGQVSRVKGIFDLADGQSIYGDFVSSVIATDFTALNLPRWLNGRPQRFSGIEILGQNLDEEAIAQTLRSSCLSEAAIRHYQQQSLELTEA